MPDPEVTAQEDEAFDDLERRGILKDLQPAPPINQPWRFPKLTLPGELDDDCICTAFGEDRNCPVHGHDA